MSRSWRLIFSSGCLLLMTGVGSLATAQPNPAAAADVLTRLQKRGRPTEGPVSALRGVAGPVTSLDADSITLPTSACIGIENATREDWNESDLACRWVRHDPSQPILVLFQGWEVQVDQIAVSRKGTRYTLLTGEDIALNYSELPARRFIRSKECDGGEKAMKNAFFLPAHFFHEARVGDVVSLTLRGTLGKEEVTELRIMRRPGGRVPHSTTDLERFRLIIDRYNAHQDNEDFGVPIPARFRRDLPR